MLWQAYHICHGLLPVSLGSFGGETIYYERSKSSCGGMLDVDMNRERETSVLKPVENVVWSKAPRGVYQIYVKLGKCHCGVFVSSFLLEVQDQKLFHTVAANLRNLYRHDSQVPIGFQVFVKIRGRNQTFRNFVSCQGEKIRVASVQVTETVRPLELSFGGVSFSDSDRQQFLGIGTSEQY